MKISQSFLIPHPRKIVWNCFHDLTLIVECIPGAELQSQQGDQLKGRMNIRVGPILASFLGEGRIEWDEATLSGKLSGHALDNKTSSQARAAVNFVLVEIESNLTRVNIDVETTLSGIMAQFGRANILSDIAARLTAEFAHRLKSRMVSEPTDVLAIAATEAKHPQQQGSPSELNAFSLIWSLFVNRLRRLSGLIASNR